ncbi:organomercurial lyase, partial [Escherichia coli]|uniref:organomercurial lyase n=1 Tax=Escherichia coli TaxID=562 RepID=UPI000BD94B65
AWSQARQEAHVTLPEAQIFARQRNPVRYPDVDLCVNLRSAFCDHVNLFKDERTFTAWSQARQEAHVTLPEAQIFARQRNPVRYPDVDL